MKNIQARWREKCQRCEMRYWPMGVMVPLCAVAPEHSRMIPSRMPDWCLHRDEFEPACDRLCAVCDNDPCLEE